MCLHLCDSFLLENYKIEQSHVLFRVLFQCSKPSVTQWVLQSWHHAHCAHSCEHTHT